MGDSETTVLAAGRAPLVVSEAPGARDALWLGTDALAEATGWTLRPEGLCQGDQCIPIRDALRDRYVEGDSVEAAGLWRALGRPVVADDERTTWVLGESATDRVRQLESLEAPDFELPDLEGRLHRLSHYRGRKVLLVTWASW